MSATPPLPEEDELLAAELALGLLDRDEALAAEARVERDAGFAAAYRRWQDRAAVLALGEDEAPRPSLWHAVEAALPGPLPRARAAAPLWRWQAATAACAAAAIVLGVLTLRPGPAPVPPAPAATGRAAGPPLVAVLRSAKDRTVVAVAFDRGSGRLTAAPAGLALPGHSPELWVIPADGTPRSLGVIATARPSSIAAPGPRLALLAPAVTLAISVEPVGGSPSGKPTGPVILTGKIEQS